MRSKKVLNKVVNACGKVVYISKSICVSCVNVVVHIICIKVVMQIKKMIVNRSHVLQLNIMNFCLFSDLVYQSLKWSKTVYCQDHLNFSTDKSLHMHICSE